MSQPLTTAEVRKIWIEALRSGKHKQRSFALGSTDGYRCCLGILCDIAVEHSIIPPPTTAIDGSYLIYQNRSDILPKEVQEWAGLCTANGTFIGSCLSKLNDDGQTFEQIADVIESKPAGLISSLAL